VGKKKGEDGRGTAFVICLLGKRKKLAIAY
jgi:hypothetical protein